MLAKLSTGGDKRNTRTPFPRARSNSCDCKVHSVARSYLCSGFVVMILAGTFVMAACTPRTPGSSPCLPERLHVDPQQVVQGSSVMISSAAFTCGDSYPSGKEYQLTLGLVGRQPPIDLGKYPVNTDGSFHARVVIPADASPGEAAISVRGTSFDLCDDSGQGSCAGYVVSLTIIPARP